MELQLVLDGAIVSKKNNKQLLFNRRTGQQYISSSTAYKSWNYNAIYQLRKQYKGEIIDNPVDVSCEFGLADKRRHDIDNMYTSILDTIVDAGIIKDDSLVFSGVLKKQVNGDKPVTVIKITTYNKKFLKDK